MAVEVIIWLIANGISLVVSGKDLRSTTEVWLRARRIVTTGGFRRLATRNFRASLFKFSLASSFVLAGIASTTVWKNYTVWFLILGSILLTADVLWESKYRSDLFKAALEKAERERKSKRGNGSPSNQPPV